MSNNELYVEKDIFFEKLNTEIMRKNRKVLIFGDFNSRIRKNQDNLYEEKCCNNKKKKKITSGKTKTISSM